MNEMSLVEKALIGIYNNINNKIEIEVNCELPEDYNNIGSGFDFSYISIDLTESNNIAYIDSCIKQFSDMILDKKCKKIVFYPLPFIDIHEYCCYVVKKRNIVART